MLDKNLEARTELTSMSYAAEVFLRMLNLYRGSYYKLRNAGPILSDEEQIPRAELRAALDYLQESGYIAARTHRRMYPTCRWKTWSVSCCPPGCSCWAGISRTRWCGRKEGGRRDADFTLERKTELWEDRIPAAGSAKRC